MATFAPSTENDATTGKVQWRSRFVSLPHALLTDPSFASLSGVGMKLLLALLSGYAGNNNGHLTATHSKMIHLGFSSKDSLARGLRELMAAGYILRTKRQHLRSPALYAVTWLPINPAPAGQAYDQGIAPGGQALDLWRASNKPQGRLAA